MSIGFGNWAGKKFYEPRGDCRDCKKPSDLGDICRECYAKWQTALSAVYNGQFYDLRDLWRELNALPDERRKDIAEHVRGRGRDVLRGSDAGLLARMKRLMAGPYGQSLETWADGTLTATSKPGRGRMVGGIE